MIFLLSIIILIFISFVDKSDIETCTPKDSDSCLQESAVGWTGYKCTDTSDEHCTTWERDLKRCCPEKCKSGIFTEEQCRDSYKKDVAIGVCTYPNDAQCSYQGMLIIRYIN